MNRREEVNDEMINRLVTLLMAAVFTLSFACPALSGTGNEVKGTISKIEGSKITVQDSLGMEKTIETKDPETLKDLRIGDRVSVKENLVKKEGAESLSPGSNK